MNSRNVFAVVALALAASSLSSASHSLAAGTPTVDSTPAPTATLSLPTATPSPTVTPQPEPVRPSPTVAVSPTPTITPLPTGGATPEVTKRPRPTSRTAVTATVTATASPVPHTASKKHRRHRHHRHHRHQAPKPTATPEPTATPAMNLQAENSISPVTCNGPGKPVATRPFLTPPYHGWTSIVSYFDHDMPDFSQDGLVITASGVEARPDSAHVTTDFPAYWNQSLRQYLYYDGHNGYDYDISYVPVYAAAKGRVIYAGLEYQTAPDHGYGNMVMIDHRNGYVTLYGHFSKILVHAGEKVRRGQRIGISGNTGHSTGPHLHFTVFHNCSPVDPYGWAGGGADPLSTYQGENSTYLWIRAPLITNPPPGWPGLSALPGFGGVRLLLLSLPSTRLGTASFTASLEREARHVRALLGVHVRSKLDLLRGAIILRTPIAPSRLYGIPDIVSIGSLDAASPAHDDVLAALAQASLVTRHRTLRLGRSRDWTGFFVNWQGETLLVGRGTKGQAIDLKVSHGKHDTLKTVQANASTGAYAVDLGKLSPSQRIALRHELEALPPRVHRVRIARVAPARAIPVRRGSAPVVPWGAGAALLLLLAAAASAILWARNSPSPKSSTE
ncbi:MAG: peptidoglycan DD-metalloendopeptidase family protein [Chloroflexota bacterium]|nr:peptidoglycan DD-metalloendopeptidase family protein [Chloroflexota bacterium]